MHVVGTLLRNLYQERRALHCTTEFTLAKTKSVRFKVEVRFAVVDRGIYNGTNGKCYTQPFLEK